MAARPYEPLRRTTYSNGMLLQAEDLIAEQGYYEHRLCDLARRLGFGIIEGLDVTLDGDCLDRLRVAPGRAVDQGGRELVLSNECLVEADDFQASGDKAFVCLVHDSNDIVQVPSLKPHAGSSSGDEHPITISREEAGRITVLPAERLPLFAWRYAPVGESRPVTISSTDCVVPLAWASFQRQQQRFDPLDTLGRPIAGGFELTRIAGLSWDHGGIVCSIDDLVVTFSADLLEEPPAAALMVLIETSDGSLRTARQPSTTLPFMRIEDGADAACHRHRIRISLPADLAPDSTVRLRLACNFVLDERGVPVSGAHQGGRLPSGDGRAGSVFESWFHIGAASSSPEAYDDR